MSSRPTVTASFEQPHEHLRSFNGMRLRDQPGITIEVCFTLHEHGTALADLERAVADVRAQIEETA